MVPASKVVPGDILVLETGGIAAADGRILQATGLTCNESSLTGEALNVEKNEKSLFYSRKILLWEIRAIWSFLVL